MQTATKQTLKSYWKHSTRYKGRMSFIALMILFTCVIDIYQPLVGKDLFNHLAARRFSEAVGLVWYLLALNLLAQAGWRSMGYAINRFQPKVMSDILNSCYEYLLDHSYSFFTSNFIGSIVTRIRRYQHAYERITDVLIFNLLRTALKMLFVHAVLFYLFPRLGWPVLAWTVVYLLIAYAFTKYKLQYDIRQSEQETKTTAHLADTLTNNVNIMLFARKKGEARSFAQITEKLYRLRKEAWDFGTHVNIFQSIALAILEFGVMLYAVKLAEKGMLTIGDIVLLQTFVLQMFYHLWEFGRNLKDIYESLADANEMTEMLMESHEIVDRPDAKKLNVAAGGIEFRDVSFQYQEEMTVFRRFNLTIAPGERVALVGPSGSGKSTVVKILFRFKDLQKGQVLIDGQDITQVTQDSLRRNVSLVPQEPILFHRTLLENIRYGKPDATKEEVIAAAKAAHAHEFISKFPEGYDTFVGERGVKLSGGERQRVAIARAILKNAPILVLDEATSSLDSESESLIQDALEALMRGKTTIVIAHRLSTIMKMDRIIVMDQGKIKEQGRHEELVKASQGIYQKLWEIQAGGFAAANK